MRYVDRRMAQLGLVSWTEGPYGAPIAKRSKYPPNTTEKPCSRCKVIKPLDAFSLLKGGALGLAARCKSCICALGKEYTRKHREEKAGRPRPDRCDCCCQPHTARRAMHWDHDHSTDRFRGWLCHSCNHALGVVKDNVEQLQQLIDYMNRGGGPA